MIQLALFANFFKTYGDDDEDEGDLEEGEDGETPLPRSVSLFCDVP
jgi:hypothetical protein